MKSGNSYLEGSWANKNAHKLSIKNLKFIKNSLDFYFAAMEIRISKKKIQVEKSKPIKFRIQTYIVFQFCFVLKEREIERFAYTLS